MFFFTILATTEIYPYCPTLSLPDALPICATRGHVRWAGRLGRRLRPNTPRITIAEPASVELQRLRRALGAASTAEPSDLCIVAAGSLRGLPIPKSAGPLAVVVTAEDVSIAAEPLDMLGAASVVVSDSLWTLSQQIGRAHV